MKYLNDMPGYGTESPPFKNKFQGYEALYMKRFL